MNSLIPRAFLIVTWLCHFYFTCVHPQPATDQTKAPNARVRISLDLSLYLIIMALVSAFAFMGLFFSLSLRYCWRSQPHHQARLQNPSPRNNSCAHGVNPTVLHSFPILVYSTIKQHKVGKGVHECAVCLSEFRDCDTLILLPKCDHIFHPDCIHAWLAFHITCPVCRANLAENSETCGCGTTVEGIPTSTVNDATESDPLDFNGNINRRETDHSEKGQQRQQAVMTVYPDECNDLGSQETAVNIQDDVWPEEPRMPDNLHRAHSTGHSLAEPGDNMERYTLRLPEEVRKQFGTDGRKLRRSATYDAVNLGEITMTNLSIG